MNTQMSVVTKLTLEFNPHADTGDSFLHVAHRMFRVATPSVEQWCVDDGAHVEWDYATGKLPNAENYLRSIAESTSTMDGINDLIDDIEQNILLGAVFIRLRRSGRFIEIWMAM